MAKRSKRTNRLISFMCLSVFALSLFCVCGIGVIIYQKYQENQRLEQEYQQMQEEYDNLQQIYDNTDGDGYYNVYSDGELVIYGVGGVIIID